MMFEGETVAFDPRWKEYDAEEWSDALVTSMRLGGVEHIFFVSGAEIAFTRKASQRRRCADGRRRS